MIYTRTNIQINLTSTDSLTGASDAKILFKKPDGNTGTWFATVTGNDITYNTASTDLDLPGQWVIQGQVTIGGNRLLTTQMTMTVGDGFL